MQDFEVANLANGIKAPPNQAYAANLNAVPHARFEQLLVVGSTSKVVIFLFAPLY
jgi:hypothetical protein